MTKQKSIVLNAESVAVALAGGSVVVPVRLPKRLANREIVNGEVFDPDYEAYTSVLIYSPYGPIGSQVWVKEAFCHTVDAKGTCCLMYRADSKARYVLAEDDGEGDWCELTGEAIAAWPSVWRSPRSMQRWASRLTLEFTGLFRLNGEWCWQLCPIVLALIPEVTDDSLPPSH